MYKDSSNYSKMTYSIIEGADFKNATDVDSVNQNMKTVINLEQSLLRDKSKIYTNYTDLSQNIGTYIDTKTYLSANNAMYHYDDEQDPNLLVYNKKPKDIRTVINDDINELKLFQNSIYITGVIACSTLLIVAILISKK